MQFPIPIPIRYTFITISLLYKHRSTISENSYYKVLLCVSWWACVDKS